MRRTGVDRIRASRRPLSLVSDRRKVLPQYVMPKRGLTAFAGHVASRDLGQGRERKKPVSKMIVNGIETPT